MKFTFVRVDGGLGVVAVDWVGVLCRSQHAGEDVLGGVSFDQLLDLPTEQHHVAGTQQEHSSSALHRSFDQDFGAWMHVQVQLGQGDVLHGLDVLGAVGQVQQQHPFPFRFPFGVNLFLSRYFGIALGSLADSAVLGVGRQPNVDDVADLGEGSWTLRPLAPEEKQTGRVTCSR